VAVADVLGEGAIPHNLTTQLLDCRAVLIYKSPDTPLFQDVSKKLSDAVPYTASIAADRSPLPPRADSTAGAHARATIPTILSTLVTTALGLGVKGSPRARNSVPSCGEISLKRGKHHGHHVQKHPRQARYNEAIECMLITAYLCPGIMETPLAMYV
jgi:hypothetical protein